MADDKRHSDNSSSTAIWRSAGLFVVRYGIGGVMILAGVMVLVAVGGEIGAYGFSMAVGAGFAVMLLNLLYRMSVSGDRDRDREEEARTYLDEHGVWPDDEESQPRLIGRRWTLARRALTAGQDERDGRRADGRQVPATVGEGR